MKRAVSLFLVLAGLLLAAALWRRGAEVDPVPSPRAGVVQVMQPGEKSPRAPSTRSPDASSPVRASQPGDAARRTDAGTGSGEAMLQRGLALLPCSEPRLARQRQRLSGRDNVLRTLDAALARKAYADIGETELHKERDKVAGLAQLERDVIAGCEGIPAAERDNGLALMQRAAEAGVPGARTAYARNAFEDYVTAADVWQDLDEARRRRDLARRFLDEAKVQCDPDVWSARFDLRGVAALDSHDAAAQVAIIQAYYSAQLARGEDAAHLQHVRDTLDAAAEGLDPAARERAVRQGEADVARCAASLQGHP